MRRVFGITALALGIVLIAGAPVMKWVAAPVLIKAPLDVDSITVSEGGSQVFVLTSQSVANVHVIATRAVRGDKAAGTSSVAVYDESLCLRTSTSGAPDRDGCVAASDPGFVQKTTDRIAFDRKSGLAVNDARFHTHVNGDASIQHDGLGYTFPVGTGKQTYPFFDTVLGKAFPMNFQATDKVNGLSVYRFSQTVPESDIKINGILPGTYSNVRTVWVEPATGVIVKGSEQLTQKFAAGPTAFAGTIVFNGPTVQERVKYAKDHLAQIRVVRSWAPLGLLVLGVLMVVVGVLLVRRRPPVALRRDDQLASSQI
jgi:Porin PorA